jgi:hypothetical protein
MARLISTRVIVIEDNQRFHSCVAPAWSSEYVTGQERLQYVMAAGGRLMRMRPDPALWLWSLHDLHSNSADVVQDGRLHVVDRSDTKVRSGLLIRLEFSVVRLSPAGLLFPDGTCAASAPTGPQWRMDGEALGILPFSSEPPLSKKQRQLTSHVLHFYSFHVSACSSCSQSALRPAGADSLC